MRSFSWFLASFVAVVQHLLTVTPVVGILPEHHKFEPRANAGEVDAIFDVPIEMFLKVYALDRRPHLPLFLNLFLLHSLFQYDGLVALQS